MIGNPSSERAAVCPDCRDVKRHPHWIRCDYMDLSVSMSVAQIEAEGRMDWRLMRSTSCPRCRGTTLDWEPNHLASGAGRPPSVDTPPSASTGRVVDR